MEVSIDDMVPLHWQMSFDDSSLIIKDLFQSVHSQELGSFPNYN